tara:strand:- start:1947 stop:3179 length:1233 start_codon:yes stop_codon:yes gene_type:complete
MRISLINPPHPNASYDRCDTPLGLAYIASYLEGHGYNVSISDFTGGYPWDIEEADIYGISVYAPTIDVSRSIAEKCREKNPESRIVVGGAHPTMMPESIDFADTIVTGEGERAMLDVAVDYPALKKRYSHSLDGRLDMCPNPAYHLVDIESYSRKLNGETCLSILTSRGCPWRCAFCALPPQHKKVKYRSIQAVAAEISKIKNEYGVNKFNFQDDTFTYNQRRLFALLDEIRPLNIGFRCNTRAGLDNADSYRKLKEAGCELVCFGIESGSQKMLNLMNKKTTVQQNRKAVQEARKAGLRVKVFFVLGFPGETAETAEETRRFIEQTEPDECLVNNFVPFPGTDVWNNPKKYGIIHIEKDFSNYYQINGAGYGGRNVSTDVLSSGELLGLEIKLRSWIKEYFSGRVLQKA